MRTFDRGRSGITVYFIGDVSKLHLKSTEVSRQHLMRLSVFFLVCYLSVPHILTLVTARQVAVRVHDACCGSDVFGTDICTCRPYLVYAIEQVCSP